MSILAGDVVTQLAFSVYENKGVYAVLVGSGLSRAADIPTGWEITLDLIRRVAMARDVPQQADWAEWYRQETGDEPNYSLLLEEIAASPDERRAILHSYIEPTPEEREVGRKTPTAAHYAIADLVRDGFVRVIVTTNFDRLMETALRDRGIEPTVVASVDAFQGAEPLTHSRCYLLKLHGDYKDARILNTDQELSSYPPEYDRLLDRIIDEHGLIVAGWSGAWDHALRSALMRAPSRRYPTYWTARGELNDGAAELVAHRSARVVAITDADAFFRALQSRVETLQQTHRQNPLSIDLAVSTTKRLMAKPEHRIQLTELISEYAERTFSEVAAGMFPPHGAWSVEEFRSRTERYEAASEPLARMVGVLGRWGDDSEFSLVFDSIASQYEAAEKEGNGLVVWLGLRSYPAVLIFTSYALGLCRAGRWATLHRLFTETVYRDYRADKRAVEVLFANSWKGGDKDNWNSLKDFGNRRTPLNDHLCALFESWGKSFCPLTPDFELLFERFEILASLAFLEQYSEAQLAEAQKQSQPWVWMPFGRIAWDGTRREKLVEWLSSDTHQPALLSAGFAQGSASFMQIYLANLSWISGRIGW